MKRNALFLLMILAPFFIKAQMEANADAPNVPLDEEGQIRYKEVVEEPASQQDLFKRCVKWINGEYKNPSTVTPTRDMVNGKIVITHVFRLQNTLETGTVTDVGDVMYDFTIQFKDNRYRLEMTNFVLKKASRFPAEKWLDKTSADYNPDYIRQLDVFAKGLIESLKAGMKPAKEYKEEEW